MCNSIYIGETTRHFYTRCREHEGYSPRTGTAYRNPPNSNIYRHQQEQGHPILLENLEILLTTDSYNLEIAESIQIHCIRPNLNVNTSSVPLIYKPNYFNMCVVRSALAATGNHVSLYDLFMVVGGGVPIASSLLLLILCFLF